jgi:hypothetical protein
LATLYCDYVAGRAAEPLNGVGRDEVHAWLRKRFTECHGLLRHAEQGAAVPPDAGHSIASLW